MFRVAMNEAVGHELRTREDILESFRRHELAVRQLENVLLTVDELQVPVRENPADVTSVHPAITIYQLFARFRILEVTCM